MKSPTAKCFAKILGEFPLAKEILPHEVGAAFLTMKYLFWEVKRSESVDLRDIEKLTLLCCDKKMQNAVCTVINDKVELAVRLKQTSCYIPFVEGFAHEHKPILERQEVLECVEKLPKSSRPFMLSEIIDEKIDITKLQQHISPFGQNIESYIKSACFKRCFLRLVRHSIQISNTKGRWTEQLEASLQEKLNKISIVGGTGISTVIHIRIIENGTLGDLVKAEGSEQKKWIHIKHAENGVEVIIDDTNEFLEQDVTSCLKEHLIYITNGLLLEKFESILLQLLNYKNSDQRSQSILDHHHILEYEAKVTESQIYPEPGTFVPKELHKYLDNDYGFISEFHYRFIAYLVEDPGLEDDVTEHDDFTPTYIFVTVLGKVGASENPMFQEYKINDGNKEPKTVKGYLLYTFVRQHYSEDNTDALFDSRYSGNTQVVSRPNTDLPTKDIPEPKLSLREICNEIRTALIEAYTKELTVRRHLVKRLMLKWHPDKNPDRVAIATKAFQYLQQCLDFLDRGLKVPEYADKDSDNGTDSSTFRSSSGGNSSWYGRYWNRYRESYRDDDWFPRSGFRGGERGSGSSWRRRRRGRGGWGFTFDGDPFDAYTRFYRTPTAYPRPTLARKWQTQARFDVEEARRNLNDAENKNNWICYKAHQVRPRILS